MKIEVRGTEAECQAFIEVIQERTAHTDINVAIEVHPLPDPTTTTPITPLVLIQGGKSQRKVRSVELPRVP
jgi:hypothetical protein